MRVETDELGALSVANYSSPLDVPELAAVIHAGNVRSSTSSVAEGNTVVAARALGRHRLRAARRSRHDRLHHHRPRRAERHVEVRQPRAARRSAAFASSGSMRSSTATVCDSSRHPVGAVPRAAVSAARSTRSSLSRSPSPSSSRASCSSSPVRSAPTSTPSSRRRGLSMRLLQPNEVVSGAQASRQSSGVLIESTFDGSKQQALATLIDLVPPDRRGAIGPVPNPVSMLGETHLTTVSLGAASVSASAAPPVPAPRLPDQRPPHQRPRWRRARRWLRRGPPRAHRGGGTAVGDTGGGASVDGEPIGAFVGQAVPALAVALLVLGAPFFAAGSSRLADNVLSPVASGCPEGRDRSPASEG